MLFTAEWWPALLVPRLRRAFGGLLESIGSRLPPPPHAYTLAGVALSLLGAAEGVQGRYTAALLLFALGAVMDALDGAVARAHGLASRRGALLDSVTDRVSDAALAAGLWGLIHPLAVYTLAVSMLIYSYVRARAEGVLCEKLEGVGLLERGERTPLLLLAYLLAAAGLRWAASLLAYGLTAAVAAAAAARVVEVYRIVAKLDSPRGG